jgi:hypothetical protein
MSNCPYSVPTALLASARYCGHLVHRVRCRSSVTVALIMYTVITTAALVH